LGTISPTQEETGGISLSLHEKKIASSKVRKSGFRIFFEFFQMMLEAEIWLQSLAVK